MSNIFSLLDACHVMGKGNFYKYWPDICFLTIVSKLNVAYSEGLKYFGTYHIFSNLIRTQFLAIS